MFSIFADAVNDAAEEIERQRICQKALFDRKKNDVGKDHVTTMPVQELLGNIVKGTVNVLSGIFSS